MRVARQRAGVVPDQDLNARMKALGSAKPRSAAISAMRRSLSKRPCAASNRTSSARPEKVTPNASSRWASVRALCAERAADAVARQRAGPNPRPHDRFDGRDEVAFGVGDGFYQQRGQDLRVVRISIAHRPVERRRVEDHARRQCAELDRDPEELRKRRLFARGIAGQAHPIRAARPVPHSRRIVLTSSAIAASTIWSALSLLGAVTT